MEKLHFDQQGFLKPYEKTNVSLEEFQVLFVDDYPQSRTRALIFEQYLQFIEDFKKSITLEFEHWLDGSFLTKKLHPNDLDFVILLDHKIALQYALLLRHQFAFRNVKAFYPNLDVYILEIFPENHINHINTISDTAYWLSWFSRTKPNFANKTFPKGFISIKY